MKLVVTSTDNNLDAKMDPRFGRCSHFLLVDSETMEFDALDNTAAAQGSGAGIAAAQAVADAGADAVLSGNFGPNAFKALSQGGLQLYSGDPSMSVRDNVEAFRAGKFEPVGGATAAAKSGMGSADSPSTPTGAAGMGGGRGMGMGGGRGMGMGGGRGMGMGSGRGMGMGGGGRGMSAGMPGGLLQATPQADTQSLKEQIAELQGRVQELVRKLGARADQ